MYGNPAFTFSWPTVTTSLLCPFGFSPISQASPLHFQAQKLQTSQELSQPTQDSFGSRSDVWPPLGQNYRNLLAFVMLKQHGGFRWFWIFWEAACEKTWYFFGSASCRCSWGCRTSQRTTRPRPRRCLRGSSSPTPSRTRSTTSSKLQTSWACVRAGSTSFILFSG